METHPDGGPPAPLLQVDGVTLAFGGVKALSGVGFDVQPGSITAVIGPNGAGKTSLFNTISGFYRPTGGSIRFQGEDITRESNMASLPSMTRRGTLPSGLPVPGDSSRLQGFSSTN